MGEMSTDDGGRTDKCTLNPEEGGEKGSAERVELAAAHSFSHYQRHSTGGIGGATFESASFHQQERNASHLHSIVRAAKSAIGSVQTRPNSQVRFIRATLQHIIWLCSDHLVLESTFPPNRG